MNTSPQNNKASTNLQIFVICYFFFTFFYDFFWKIWECRGFSTIHTHLYKGGKKLFNGNVQEARWPAHPVHSSGITQLLWNWFSLFDKQGWDKEWCTCLDWITEPWKWHFTQTAESFLFLSSKIKSDWDTKQHYLWF